MVFGEFDCWFLEGLCKGIDVGMVLSCLVDVWSGVVLIGWLVGEIVFGGMRDRWGGVFVNWLGGFELFI